MRGVGVVVGVTGASGAVYARLTVEALLRLDVVGRVGVVFSGNGRAVAEYEGVRFDDLGVDFFDDGDMFASPASGSAGWGGMVVVPCSMGTVARVATGVSDSLLTRAADVMLKERRPLVVVPREMPLGTLHLRNLLTLSELGAVVIPACPAFYSGAGSVEALCGTVVERIVEHLGFEAPRFRWGEQ